MKPLVLMSFFLTASAFAQNTPTVEQRCQEIVRLEAALGELLVKYTEKHPEVVRLREEIAAQRTELQKASPGYVCNSPIAALSESKQPEDQRAGIIAPRSNVTQPNVRQPNGCDTVQAAQKRVSVYRRQMVSQLHTDAAMQAAMVQLSSLEDAMQVEMSRTASQGVDCSAANLLFVCDRIWFFHKRSAERRQQLTQPQTDEHPDTRAAMIKDLAIKGLPKLEAWLAGERARAASQGIDCSATDAQPEKTEPGRR